ncbi:MAG: serine hydrolase [Chthoniobacteraceae bacterium]
MVAHAQQPAAYVVFDATTGHVLESAAGDRKLQVGSLTKIATAMVALDWSKVSNTDLARVVPISPNGLALPSENPIGWQLGDAASLRDLLYSAMMQSDNIAAQTIAEFIGSQLPGETAPAVRFVNQMNALGREIGMKHTLFLNPHGIDSIENKRPYSTAYDLGRLAKYAMANSAFRFYVSQKQRVITIMRGPTQTRYMLQNTNQLLGTNNIDGVKTGTTRLAGECVIVSSALAPESRPAASGNGVVVTPRRLLVVVLNCPQRFEIANAFVTRGWQEYEEWAARGRPMTRASL